MRRARRASGAAIDQSLVGEYYSAEVDATYHIRLAGGQALIDRPPGRVDTLVVAAGEYRGGGMTYTFERSAGNVTAFSVQAGRVRNIRFVRR